MVGRSICRSNGSAQFELRPTRARPFDRVANDPRMAFMREGYMWRLTIMHGCRKLTAQRPLYDHISEIASNSGVKKGQAYE